MRTQTMMLLWTLALLWGAGCDDDDPADGGAPPLDAASDGRVDGSPPDDMAADGTTRDAVVDATADATADARVDATLDAATDATLDATLDATADATADARLDHGADASPDQGGDCVPAGGFIPIVPGAPSCCPGLLPIGCERPDPAGTCPAGCEGASICAACGDGVCGPGENPCNCFADCPPLGPCDDGSVAVCEIEPPVCAAGELRAVIDGCWLCVNPATCEPWGRPGCAADADCDPGEVCDACGTSSCPDCDDCVAACRPDGGPACQGADPSGCMDRGCPAGLICEIGDACIPSACFCDGGLWVCTEDCGGGECVAPMGALRWYETCGDPVCRGHMPVEGMPLCMVDESPGAACADPDRLCDPVDPCNVRRVCADRDPRMGGPCPISRAEHKREIHYLDDTERRRYAATLLATPLATWRYHAAPAARPSLGFIIDDGIAPEAITADGDRVDLYGYTSLAVAAVQVQAEEIARLRAELDALRARIDATESQCR